MPNNQETYLTHRELIIKMLDNGFLQPGEHKIKDEKEVEGVCNGIAFMGMIASLCNDIVAFNNRLKLIKDTNDLNERIASIYRKLQTHSKEKQEKEDKAIQDLLTEEDRNFLEILIFFQSIELFLQPWYYPQLFKEFKEDDYLELFMGNTSRVLKPGQEIEVAKLIAAKKIEQQGGLISLNPSSGMYSIDELILYFQLLDHIVKNQADVVNVGLIISTVEHAISVCYNANEKQWEFTDANHLPARVYKDVDTLARKVFKAFETTEEGFTTFTTTIYGTKVNEPTIKAIHKELKATHEYKELHKVTDFKASQKSSRASETWLYNAIFAGEFDVVKELVEKGANIHHQLKYENLILTPFKFAAANGFNKSHKIIKEYLALVEAREILMEVGKLYNKAKFATRTRAITKFQDRFINFLEMVDEQSSSVSVILPGIKSSYDNLLLLDNVALDLLKTGNPKIIKAVENAYESFIQTPYPDCNVINFAENLKREVQQIRNELQSSYTNQSLFGFLGKLHPRSGEVAAIDDALAKRKLNHNR